MNKEQAKRLIKDTFEAPFDKEKFTVFIKNLLNKIDETKAFHVRGYVKYAFKQVAEVIKTYERLGTYTNPSGKKIDVLIVYLQKDNSLERARTTMRNFVAKYLKDRGEKDAGLVAFVPPSKEDWRFSLVKMDYRFEETPSGRVKIKEEFTPAHRWSFLVGKNEKSHTAQSRLVDILEDDEHNPTLAELGEAFNIEPVTKEFFEKYRELFRRTVDELDSVVKKDEMVRKDFEFKNINTVDFAKKLLGQIVFLYFLQKKGWFGVSEDKKWGEGDKNFIRNLFLECSQKKDKNFFNDYLEYLFYDALNNNNRKSADPAYYGKFNCKIPFLNGGLFEPIGSYDWGDTDIILPNGLFSNNRRTPEGDKGDGILDVFDRFNFTVREDEPLEKEVAIDPELLGKLYEKFNAIRPDNFYEYKGALSSGKKTVEKKFNKQYGVYYTPREIVHYMCQQSLINYLYTELNQRGVAYENLGEKQLQAFRSIEKRGQYELTIKHTSSLTVQKKDIETLIKYGEQFAENEAVALIKKQRINEEKQKTSDYKLQLDSIRENAKIIDEKLKAIRVCDPAVGSGAFPVGMMAEIVKARNVLSTYIKEPNRTSYNFKRDCIESSLYGVDIDPGACEVAKLRLWLSLVVDEEDITQIKPLPNLDYKIVCGNSLLSFPENWGSPIEKEIEALMDEYFSITNSEKKRVLKTKIDEKIKSRYATSEKMFGYKIDFDFKTVFSKVFREKGGFDVVIANPPYVRQERIKDYKPSLQKADYKVYNSTSDLYTYFYEKSYNILAGNKFLCFISSNKWMRAKYGEKLRKFFKTNTEVLNLIDFGGYPVFEATVDTNIILLQKTRSDKGHQVNYVNVQSKIDGDLIKYIEENQNTIYQDKLSDNAWTMADEGILKLKEKIERIGKPLKDWDVKIFRGVTTGLNEVFIVDEKTKNELVKRDKKSSEILKPILRGKDINKWYYQYKGFYLIYTYTGIDIKKYGAIYEYLEQYKSKLEQVWEAKYGKKKWYELRGCNYYSEFEKEKIAWREIVDHSKFTWDDKGYFALAKVFIMTGKENNKYLLAILNSTLGDFAIKKYYSPFLGKEINEFKKEWVQKLPIPRIPESNQKPFIEIMDKILEITKDEDYLTNSTKQVKVKEYEHQIDQMVYKLYGLRDEEIALVEENS